MDPGDSIHPLSLQPITGSFVMSSSLNPRNRTSTSECCMCFSPQPLVAKLACRHFGWCRLCVPNIGTRTSEMCSRCGIYVDIKFNRRLNPLPNGASTSTQQSVGPQMIQLPPDQAAHIAPQIYSGSCYSCRGYNTFSTITTCKHNGWCQTCSQQLQYNMTVWCYTCRVSCPIVPVRYLNPVPPNSIDVSPVAHVHAHENLRISQQGTTASSSNTVQSGAIPRQSRMEIRPAHSSSQRVGIQTSQSVQTNTTGAILRRQLQEARQLQTARERLPRLLSQQPTNQQSANYPNRLLPSLTLPDTMQINEAASSNQISNAISTNAVPSSSLLNIRAPGLGPGDPVFQDLIYNMLHLSQDRISELEQQQRLGLDIMEAGASQPNQTVSQPSSSINKCVVCSRDGQKVRVACGHFGWCVSCNHQWVKKQKQYCPSCRMEQLLVIVTTPIRTRPDDDDEPASKRIRKSVEDEAKSKYPVLIDVPEDLIKYCCVCLDNDRDIAFNPCGHRCVCEDCATDVAIKHGTCPMCRTPIVNFLRVFL